VPGDVLACLEELGIEFRVNDDEALGRCPMHLERTGVEDRHPSWSVRIEDRFLDSGEVVPAGTHNCFSCGYRGSFTALVCDVLKVDWVTAVQWVRQRGGIERARMLLARKREPRRDEIDTTKQINEASLALFVDPPKHARNKRGISLDACHALDIRWDDSRDLWICPIRDPDTGKLWGWQEKNERYFRNRPASVPKSKTLFGIRTFTEGRAIVVESPLDTARILTAGITGALSTFGAAVSNNQMDLLVDIADEVIWALDNDKDGRKYSKQIKELWGHRMPMRFLNYDSIDKKDPGEMEDQEIRQAVYTAKSVILARF
jgi:DNA primase